MKLKKKTIKGPPGSLFPLFSSGKTLRLPKLCSLLSKMLWSSKYPVKNTDTVSPTFEEKKTKTKKQRKGKRRGRRKEERRKVAEQAVMLRGDYDQ